LAPNKVPAVNQRQKQRGHILALLREAGPVGVSKAFLIFEKRWTQCGARVFELEQAGYRIRHESREGSRYVTFVLIGEPTPAAPVQEQQPTQGTFALCDALERTA
jgi:hypothetical protein